MLEGPFHFHLGLFVLDFLQTTDPRQMDHLFSAVWVSSGLAQTAVAASSLDSWPIDFPSTPTQRVSSLNYDLYYAPE